jgi:uncharacterized protein
MVARQIAALPYRVAADGQVSIMLVTSRETRRWVIPKGNLMKGLTQPEAAAREAFEEAGLHGIVDPLPAGTYHYDKRRRNGTTRPVLVTVYPLAVSSQADRWPEQGERMARWCTPGEAAALVEEPELSSLLAGFEP